MPQVKLSLNSNGSDLSDGDREDAVAKRLKPGQTGELDRNGSDSTVDSSWADLQGNEK